MALTIAAIPMPKATRTVESKYNFGDLAVGEALIETDLVDVKKAQSRLTSALVAYRGRSSDRSKFSIRAFKQEDGTDAVGCWKTADAPAAPVAE